MKTDNKLLLYKKLSFWLAIAFLVLSTVVIVYALINQRTLELKYKVVLDLCYQIMTTIIAILIFGFFYQEYLEQENSQLLKKNIIESMLLNDDVLTLFTKEKKLVFIENIVKSLIGEKYGIVLFDSLIKRYLEQDILYRENYEYNVEINESKKDFKLKDNNNISKETYYLLTQSITYSKHFKAKINPMDYKIVFAFNEESLNNWFDDQLIFFREVIDITPLKNCIESYNKSDLQELVQNLLCLKISFYDKNNKLIAPDIHYSVDYISEKNKKGLEVIINKKDLSKCIIDNIDTKYYRCNVSFHMPVEKIRKRFHFVLPEPTLSPKFSIRFDTSFLDIDYVEYLTNSSKEVKISKDIYLSKYSICTTEMIYPRSGIVFFWN